MKPIAAECLEALSMCAVLFSRVERCEYFELSDGSVWESLAKTALAYFDDVEHRDECARLAVPPALPVIETTQNNLLVSGMPLAALPVESLYKQWSAQKGGDLAASKGLYLGDSAQHMAALYKSLEIEVPDEFAAMPDHLSLLLEFMVLLLEQGNDEAARQLAADHFDWLDGYCELLAERARDAANVEAYAKEKRRDLEEGILFYRALALLAAIVIGQLHCSDRVE
ncbi:molecular chaperone TorD family protein [Raoultibacter massiliensis]|uniref:molecular chaperone TorD family protein n=1 Tax=Raoultibacter massiliensis TaxID=1852371 RepID=UPI003A913264